MIELFTTYAPHIFITFTGVYLVSLVRRDMSIVDVAWGLGFVLLALTSLPENAGPRAIIITTLVTLWGLRLAFYIFCRNYGQGEDKRYAAWRQNWGAWAPLRSYFQVFLLQGAILLIIALPMLWINTYSYQPITYLDITAVMVWCVGFFFEAVGDYQLAAFKRHPKNRGQVFNGGLWRYTRHPNYFGESVMWWAIWLLAVNVTQGWQTIASPILLTFLLLRVSGVSLLEKTYDGNDAYARYKRRTSAFIPWSPKDD